MKFLLCRRRFVLGMLPLMTACASMAPVPAPPLLRLSPASLGGDLALRQRLTIGVGGTTHSLEAVLEADAQAVRLAVVSLGQTAARLEWDGQTLTQSRADWWPAAIGGDRILSDLQLMLWPAAAVSAALPQGWTLEHTPQRRQLRFDGNTVVQVDYLSPAQSELNQFQARYRIRVDSQKLGDGQ
ncbi:MAG: DUF3261 domain-containing protein [Burkholderiales bacterium]|nr:DUF3261 domain-containing protein [Burkholderiales bacterium]